MKSKLRLSAASTFEYLNQSGCIEIDGVDDSEEFGEVRRAMELLSFSKQEMADIFEICAGVLHMGNIAFQSSGDRASKVSSAKSLEDTAHLLQVKKDALEQVCVTRKMQVTGQAPITIGLGAEEARAARDALSKFIYEVRPGRLRSLDDAALFESRIAFPCALISPSALALRLCTSLDPSQKLFDWLVERINKSIGNGGAAATKGRSIGILDIFGQRWHHSDCSDCCVVASDRLFTLFCTCCSRCCVCAGFEIFKKNSFEQLCINFVRTLHTHDSSRVVSIKPVLTLTVSLCVASL